VRFLKKVLTKKEQYAIVFSMTFYRNIPEMSELTPATLPGVALIFEYLIPFSLLAIALIKRKVNSKSAVAHQST